MQNKFHDHLDVCGQCREHPFDLFDGAKLLHETASDIHRETAARALGIKPEDVTEETRRAAKAVNFGQMYSNGSGRIWSMKDFL